MLAVHTINGNKYLYFHCRLKGQLYALYIGAGEKMNAKQLFALAWKIKRFYDKQDPARKKVCIRCNWHSVTSVYLSLLLEARQKGILFAAPPF